MRSVDHCLLNERRWKHHRGGVCTANYGEVLRKNGNQWPGIDVKHRGDAGFERRPLKEQVMQIRALRMGGSS